MGTRTTNWQLYKPTLSETGWGDEVNVNFDDIEDGLSAITNVKAPNFGALGNGSNDDTAEIQAAIDATDAGGIVFFPPGVYMISSPLIVPEYRTLQGSIWAANNATTNANSQIKMVSGGAAGTWGRKGMITHAYYTGADSGQGPIQVRDLYINGNSQSVGSGICVMGSCNIIERCLIDNFNGTTDWVTTASSTAGSGYGIVMTTCRFNGTDQGQNQVNSWFKHLRIGSNNNSIYIQKTVAGGITDWVIDDVVCLRPPAYTHAKDDLYLEAAGGGLIRHVHTNGSAGSGIHIASSGSGMTRIMECYLDGFGQGNGSGVYAGIQVDGNAGFDGGAGAGVSISDCNINHRTTATATAYNSIDINMANAAEITVSGVTSHIQATSGSHYFADITGTDGIMTMVNCVANTTGSAGLPFTDARIFRSSLASVVCRTEGNSWQYGTAAPTTGQWGVGMKRWDSTPASGTPMGWTCSAAGSPGTWLAMANYA